MVLIKWFIKKKYLLYKEWALAQHKLVRCDTCNSIEYLANIINRTENLLCPFLEQIKKGDRIFSSNPFKERLGTRWTHYSNPVDLLSFNAYEYSYFLGKLTCSTSLESIFVRRPSYPTHGQFHYSDLGTYPPRGDPYSTDIQSYFSESQVQLARQELKNQIFERNHCSTYGQLRLQDSITHSEMILFHDSLLVTISVIRVSVVVYYLVTRNTRLQPLHIGAMGSLDTTSEIVWTTVPLFILCSLGIPSLALLYKLEYIRVVDLTYKVVRHQWYWSYNRYNFILPCFGIRRRTPRVVSNSSDLIKRIGPSPLRQLGHLGPPNSFSNG